MAQGKVCLASDVSVVAMTPDLGAEVRGVDLTAPLSDACFARIREAFHRYCVIFLRNQALDPRLLARFAARFGEAQVMPQAKQALPGVPQIGVIPSADASAGCESSIWHSDRSFEPAPPAATLLYGVQCAEDSYAEFVNMYSVLKALPEQTRTLVEKLRGVHDLDPKEGSASLDEGAALPGVAKQAAEHPLVRVHPQTGRKALYLAKDIIARSPALAGVESRELLGKLESFATQPRFVYAHRWRTGDVLVWDNRCTLHRMPDAERAGGPILYRIWLKGEIPIAA